VPRLVSDRLGEAGRILALAIAYFAFARIALLFWADGDMISPLWPPAGFAVAVLVRGGKRFAFGVFLGAVLLAVSIGAVLPVAIGTGAGAAVEALVGAALFARFVSRVRPFDRVADVVALLVVSGVAAIVGATVAVGTLWAGGLAPGESVTDGWRLWSLGDAVGILTVTPLLLAWAQPIRRPTRAQFVSGLALAVTTVVLTGIVVGIGDASVVRSLSGCLLLPLVIWAALLGRQRAVVTVSALVAAIGVWATVHDRGPLGLDPSHHLFESLGLLDGFIAALTLTGLILAAVETRRSRAESETIRLLEAERHAQLDAERASRRTNEILESIADGCFSLDGDWKITYANSTALRLGRRTAEQAIGHSFWDVVPELVGTAFEVRYREAMRTQQVARFEAYSDAFQSWFAADAYPAPDQLTVYFRDITSRKQDEEELRAAEARYRELVEHLPLTVYTTTLGADRDALYVSPHATQMLGIPPAEAQPARLLELIHPDDQERVRGEITRAHERREARMLEYRLIRPDGRTIWLRDSSLVVHDEEGTAICAQGYLLDVTQERVLEESLRQSQKMEAVGQLAGGIAHDFNNLLTVILGRTDFALQTVAESADGAREEIEAARGAATQAAALTQSLLAFSRRQLLEPRPTAPGDIVCETMNLVGRLIGEDIAIRTSIDPSVPLIAVDPAHIQQVLMNLCLNARDAMPTGGVLELAVNRSTVRRYASGFVDQPVPGDYVEISVRDTGVGIDDETRARLFEPFFTTKPPGSGTGLGLATAYGIVRQSGGQLAVQSAPGSGTTFSLFFPPSEEPNAANEHPHAAIPDGQESVLLVEDEPAVRAVTQRLLEISGYRVHAAATANDAVAAWNTEENGFDLLLTDVVMPGLSGQDLADQLATATPSLKVLYTSGYPNGHLRAGAQKNTGAAFLQKPFTREQLSAKVRTLLDT
jgi:PAS domain S-box-containing protein